MTLQGGIRCGPCSQTRLKRATCEGCKFWRQTGENTYTGKLYGECVKLQVITFGGHGDICPFFEARK